MRRVFVLFLVFERRGLGIAHGFYIAIILGALAAGPWSGAAAGGLATGLYALGIWLNPHVPSTTIPTAETSIRAVSYLAVGAVVGLYATRNRTLNQRLTDMTHKLQTLAEHDLLTGLPNTRAFESAITRRLDHDQAFALLIGDIDGLKRINTTNVYNEGNDLLRQVAERLTHKLPADSEIARVGDDEFAILMPCEKSAEAAKYAAQLELYLDSEGARVTLGWALTPGKEATPSHSTGSQTSASTPASSCAVSAARFSSSSKVRISSSLGVHGFTLTAAARTRQRFDVEIDVS